MAVFPTAPTAAAGSPVTVLYVQKILNGDDTGATTLPAAQQCTKAPFSGKTNHDISNVRLATTTDGINFTDLGVVSGLNDPTTVDYNGTRWISPRGTLIDIRGDGSVWGLYFSGGNCLDGDSDAFHYIGYAESTDTDALDRLQRHQPPDRVDQHDHRHQPVRRQDGDDPGEPAGVPDAGVVRRAALRADGHADRLDAPQHDVRGLRACRRRASTSSTTGRSATWS